MFLKALEFVLRWEGGYSNHPADKGGATNRGITQKTYDSWQATQHLPAQSVKLLTEAEMQAIYRQNYWDAIKGDQLPWPVSLVAFDGAVNSGPRQSIKWIQRAVGTTDDGIIGPATLGLVRTGDPEEIALDVIHLREQFYLSLVAKDASQAIFLTGWLNRMAALRALVLA